MEGSTGRWVFRSVLLALLAVVAAPAVHAEDDLSGRYTISGEDDSGGL